MTEDRSETDAPETPPKAGGIAVALPLATALGAVGVAIAVSARLASWLPPAYLVLVFLVAVLAIAAGFGLWAGIVTALASFLAFNFFFIEPTWTFDVGNPQEVFALGTFLVAAVLTGGLAGRLREVADAAERRADALAALNDFAERASATLDPAAIRALIARRVAERIHGTAVLFEPGDAATGAFEAWPETPEPTPEERRSVERVFETGRIAPAAAPGFVERRFEFRPLATSTGIVAVIGLRPADGSRLVASEDETGLSALLDHAATALERARFAEESAAAEATAETERLRSALLSSLSHDLRTPLATILGSVTSLRQLGDRMEPSDRNDLLAAIEEETDRLARYVSDLLVMTRLEAGLDVRREWIDVGDVAIAAARRLERSRPGRRVEPSIAAASPPVHGEATLLEQVFFNLLDNAAAASPPQTPIRLEVGADAEAVRVTIVDRGRGMTPAEIERLFRRGGTREDRPRPEGRGGLGLPIALRVVGAMGGRIEAESPAVDGVGTRVTAIFPVVPERDAGTLEGERA